MASLAQTLQSLKSLTVTPDSSLTETSFAPNPGSLRMLSYVPPGLPPGAPLVVALHGCGQNAAGYDHGSGWSTLAERRGFAVLCPEQVRANNANTCFNWFEPGDVTRGAGEVASIAAMVAHMLHAHAIDPRRVFVTGLSAGGAMTASLLACYPDLFAAGAIVAGLPHGSATTMQAALQAMFRGHVEPGAAWGEHVRAAAGPVHGPWPRVSIWHGLSDHTVQPSNAEESVKQWLDIHGLRSAGESVPMPGAQRLVWRDAAGQAVVEHVTIAGMGHGVPIAPELSGIGAPGAFILASGVSSTEEIARFFGLLSGTRPEPRTAPKPPEPPSGITATVESAQALVDRMMRLTGMLKHTIKP